MFLDALEIRFSMPKAPAVYRHVNESHFLLLVIEAFTSKYGLTYPMDSPV